MPLDAAVPGAFDGLPAAGAWTLKVSARDGSQLVQPKPATSSWSPGSFKLWNCPLHLLWKK